LKPKGWHGWLLLFQTVACLVVAALLVCCPMEEMYREVFEGAMVCLICPTATAAAVITGKLGGSASSLTTYTLLSNLLAAVVVPLVFPWVEPHADVTFFAAFLKILSKVFPLLLLPFFMAWFLRVFVKKVHRCLLEFTDAENAAEFDAYVAKCKELSLYDTGVSAEYGDKLISLSTCEYSRNNGRLVVVAKRVD
jgi:BASS family bile acid:Na+ symporter